MIGIGALVGIGLILLDTILGAMKKLRILPLAVGIGIYLPMSATFAVVVGAVLSHWYKRRARSATNPERAERLGTLVASGLIVGESLWGVVNAALIVGFSKDAPKVTFCGSYNKQFWTKALHKYSKITAYSVAAMQVCNLYAAFPEYLCKAPID